MPVNLVKEFLKSVHTEAMFSEHICQNFEHLFHFSAGINQDGYLKSKVAPEDYINLPKNVYFDIWKVNYL